MGSARRSTALATWLYGAADSDDFAIFDAEMAAALEDAFLGGKGALVHLSAPGTELLLDLDRMVQTNVKTGAETPLLRIGGGQDNDGDAADDITDCSKQALRVAAQRQAAATAGEDARIVVLLRGESFGGNSGHGARRRRELLLARETPNWVYDLGGGGWVLLAEQAAADLEDCPTAGVWVRKLLREQVLPQGR